MRTYSLLALTACVALVSAHYSPGLAAQRDHGGFRAFPKIQNHTVRRAGAHRGKGRRSWHSDHHRHTKRVKAVLTLAAQRDHRGLFASPKIQSHTVRHASTHRGKGRRSWHSDHHRPAKRVKAVLTLAAHRDHRGLFASPKIQSHTVRHASTHRGKGRRSWHSDHHRPAKRVKAVLTLAAHRDHRGLFASPKIQSHTVRHASTHRGKGRRPWHSDHHRHAKRVKAVLTLATQRDHGGFRAFRKIQSH